MSQFRMRTSSASKSTQTESKNEHEQGESSVDRNEDDMDAVLPENVDIEKDNLELRNQELHAEATLEITKHVSPIIDDEEDDGLLALEETRC